MDLKDTLLELERSMWRNEADVYAANLTEQAVLVFAETGVIRRDVAVQAIRQENAEGRKWASVQFQDVLCVQVASGAALINYRVTARWQHDASPVSAYASSLYLEVGGRWRLAFHQQTPVQRS